MSMTAYGCIAGSGRQKVCARAVTALFFVLIVPGLGAEEAKVNTTETAKPVIEKNDIELTGQQIMELVKRRNQEFPYVYEEQSMVMVDRNGQRDTRTVRRYSRIEEDGTVKLLLLFDAPPEIKGAALLATRAPSGATEKFIYLPAYGETLIAVADAGGIGNFLGMNFSVEDLIGEELSGYRYKRRRDKKIKDVPYFVVSAYRLSDDKKNAKALRRHFISQDNYFITMTNYYDEQGHLKKRQSNHDLKLVDGTMWRANMILIEDKKEKNQLLIKIDKRVFSRDYVPEEMFTAAWLYKNRPYGHKADISNAKGGIENKPAIATPERQVTSAPSVQEVQDP